MTKKKETEETEVANALKPAVQRVPDSEYEAATQSPEDAAAAQASAEQAATINKAPSNLTDAVGKPAGPPPSNDKK